MHSPGINGQGELRGQPANLGSRGKMAVKMECVCVYVCMYVCIGPIWNMASAMNTLKAVRPEGVVSGVVHT